MRSPAHGLDVLLLEAGRQVDFEAEVRSLEWPYEHARRGKLPPDTYVLTEKDYQHLQPPYGQHFGRYTNVMSWQQLGEGPDYTKVFFVNEKEHPYTGTNFSWVRSRVLGGKTNVWGRLALRLSDYDLKAASRDGYGVDWPIAYADIAPYYDKVDRFLGISGVTENLPWLPDSIYQRPLRLNPAEVHMRHVLGGKNGWVVTPFRVGVTTEGLSHNRYRSRCYGRGACYRRVGGCDIHAAFDSPTGLIYPAWDSGRLTVRTNSTVYEVRMDVQTGRASGVSFLDTGTRKAYEAKAKAVVLAASTLESTKPRSALAAELAGRHRRNRRDCRRDARAAAAGAFCRRAARGDAADFQKREEPAGERGLLVRHHQMVGRGGVLYVPHRHSRRAAVSWKFFSRRVRRHRRLDRTAQAEQIERTADRRRSIR
jgi:choline dehydrogenase-like flavoprotein